MCARAYTFSCVVVSSCLQPNCDINAKDDSGLTALHIAVHEGHTKMVERLVGYGADLNCTTEEGNTPLHLTLGRNTMLPPSHLTPEIMKVRSYFLLHSKFEFEEHRFHSVSNLSRVQGYMYVYTYLCLALSVTEFTCICSLIHVSGFTCSCIHCSCIHCHGNTHVHAAPVQVKEELDEMCGKNTLSPNVVVAMFLVREGASIRIKNKQGFTPLQARAPDVAELIVNYAVQHIK